VPDQDRFGIPEIGEFYGATEGNASILNHCTTKEARGAVGRVGWLLNKVSVRTQGPVQRVRKCPSRWRHREGSPMPTTAL
jgi:hypothetical protein